MKRTITIQGIGKLRLKPDYTVISMSLKAANEKYDMAMETASQHLDTLQTALQRFGFAKEDLKTSRFNVSTEYDNERDKNGNYKRVFVGYVVTLQLKLEFDFNMERLAEVLMVIAGCIAQPELNVQFTVKDKEAVNAALLESACDNARAKAKILAGASGVKLGELLSIDYSWGDRSLVSPTRYEMDEACMLRASAAPSGMEITPDDIEVSDQVTFVWAIA